MKSQSIHLFIKFHEHGSGEFDGIRTMEEHLGVFREKGKMVWGHFTSNFEKKGLWDKTTDTFKEQIKNGINTFVFFCDRENRLLYVGRYNNSYKRNEVERNSPIVEYIPKYYHHKVGSPEKFIPDELRSYAYIEVTNLKEIDFKRVGEIYAYKENEKDYNEKILDARGMASIRNVNIDMDLYNELSQELILKKEEESSESDQVDIENEDNGQLEEYNETIDNVKKVLEYIHSYILSKGFIYSYESLANFYLSLKTKPFVILAGISGTGKSKLVRLFAESIGTNNKNGRFNMISVKPDWNDSTELIGYKNINAEFVPGSLIEVINDAMKHPNSPYIVCLDEMNLARVEYYLSEYLSLIESRKKYNGKIITDNIFSNTYFKEKNDYLNLYIPENLYIIGTVNMDDTTYAFSRKVLDRANTIEFSDVNFSYFDYKNNAPEVHDIPNQFLKTEFMSFKDAAVNSGYVTYIKDVNDIIIKINNILKKGKRHFGYRVRDEIVLYMLQNKKLGLLGEDVAFDYQLMQKILPSLTGSDSRFKQILIDLYNICNPVYQITDLPTYISDAEKNLDNSIYRKSAEKIIEMLRGFEDGFTSFWI